MLTGVDLSDTQCGLRAYPLAYALAVPQRFHRYDFETEILARLLWGGIALRTVPIQCIYFPREERITHYRPVIDTIRGTWANLFLGGRRLIPWPFKRLSPDATETRPRHGPWWKWGLVEKCCDR